MKMRELMDLMESDNSITSLIQTLRYDGDNELSYEEAATLANAIMDDADLESGELLSLMQKFHSDAEAGTVWDIKDDLLGESRELNEEAYDVIRDLMGQGWSRKAAEAEARRLHPEEYSDTPSRGYVARPRRPYVRRSYSSNSNKKPTMVGVYFFNVPAGQEDKAKSMGLSQTKSGKWGFKMYDTSGATAKAKLAKAEQVFGKGNYWQPKK